MTSRLAPALVGLVYAVALGVVGSLLGTWTDEEYTLATTAHGVAYAVERALHYELQAPLYFAILALWRSVDGAVWFARLFSVLCAAGTFFAFVLVGRKLAPGKDPLPFAFLVACNPFVVYAAFDIRLYALSLLLCTLLCLACEAGFAGGRDVRARAWFVGLAIAGVYVQYFVGFLLVGLGAAVVVRRGALRAYLGCCALVLAAVAPLAVIAAGQVGGYRAPSPPVGALLRLVLVHPWLDILFPYERAWQVLPFARPLYAVLIAGALVAFAWSRPRPSPAALGWLAAAATVEGVYLALTLVLRLELQPFYFGPLFAPLVIAAYALFCSPRRQGVPGPRLAVLVSALLAAAMLATDYRYLAQPGDWRRVAAYLDASVGPSDVVAVFPPDGVAALERNYRGRATPYPRAESTVTYSVANISVQSVDQARTSLARLAAAARHIWFVTPPCSPQAPAYGCRFVQRALAERRAFAARRFYDNTVYELAGSARPPKKAGMSLRRGTTTSAGGSPESLMKTPIFTK